MMQQTSSNIEFESIPIFPIKCEETETSADNVEFEAIPLHGVKWEKTEDCLNELASGTSTLRNSYTCADEIVVEAQSSIKIEENLEPPLGTSLHVKEEGGEIETQTGREDGEGPQVADDIAKKNTMTRGAVKVTSTRKIIAAACAAIIILKKKKERRRQMWVKNVFLKREEMSVYKTLMVELREEDGDLFRNFVRVSLEAFDLLLKKIYPLIKRKDTVMRKSISPGERLALTLRYLATGDSYASLQHLFRIPQCTISKIIPEVCSALCKCLKDYMKTPGTEEEWLRIAEEFASQWNFPNCIGALDGKHVAIKAPPNSGSLYYNYKGTSSIILLVLVDANYKFTYVNIGASGHNAGGAVFTNSKLCEAIQTNSVNVPNARPLPGREMAVPFVMMADDAFALQEHIMKPFKQQNLYALERVFNYRLSRARRNVENVFGVISARFRVLRRTIELSPEKVKLIVGAICVLHNFLMYSSKRLYAPVGVYDRDVNGEIELGSWRNEGDSAFLNLPPVQDRNFSARARDVRHEYKEYFVSEGEVPWQYKHI